MSALWACAEVGPAALDALRTPDTEADADDLVRRYGVGGVEAARGWLDSDAGLSAHDVAVGMHRASGIGAVGDAVRAASPDVASQRDRRLCASLRLLAVRGLARDESERALVGMRP